MTECTTKFKHRCCVTAIVILMSLCVHAGLTVTSNGVGTNIVFGISAKGDGWSYNGLTDVINIEVKKPLEEYNLTISGTERDHPVRITVQSSNNNRFLVNIENMVIHAPEANAGNKNGCALYFTDGDADSCNVELRVTGNCEIVSDADYPGVKVVGKGQMKITGNGNNAKLVAKGGNKGGGGAGIGGDSGGDFHTDDIEISNLTVEAEGGGSAAGIGGGGRKQDGSTDRGSYMGTLTISNAIIVATGSGGGAGIGCGLNGTNGIIRIIGSSVKAIGSDGASSIGKDSGSGKCGKVIFVGGSICAPQGVSPQPVDIYDELLHCVVCRGFTPPANRELSDFKGFPGWFETDCVFSDDERKVYFWLPGDDENGIQYELSIENITACATVFGEDVVASISGFNLPETMTITSLVVTNGIATMTLSSNLTGWQYDDWMELSEFSCNFKSNFTDSAKSISPICRSGTSISVSVPVNSPSGFWRVISK